MTGIAKAGLAKALRLPLSVGSMVPTQRSRMSASQWREERNRRSLARLSRVLPQVFPPQVLASALSRPLIPAMPRLAVDDYWRAHPLRAERLSRALAVRSGAPAGWSWRLASARTAGLAASFRAPPAPYREPEFRLGPGHCCVCGQEIYRFGWHVDLWNRGRNRNAEWHACCVAAWRLWNAPSGELRILKRLQKQRCARSGKRLGRASEIDHKVPLFQVWRERRHMPWPELLAYWGQPNIQVVNRDVHLEKCAVEARTRMRRPRTGDEFWPSLRHLMESLEAAFPPTEEAGSASSAVFVDVHPPG